MAWAHCSLPSFPPTSTTTAATNTTSKTLIPASFKLTKRKNYLRIKLLKTITKPNPSLPLLPQEQPEEKEEEFNKTLEIQHQEEADEPEIEVSSNKFFEKGVPVNEQTELNSYEIQVSEAGGGIVSNKSVVEMVFYFVGMFVLQTLCAVWILRDKNVKKINNLGNSKSEIVNETQNGAILPNLMGVNDDYKFQMEEIRVLAREVRESEVKKKLSDGNKLGSTGTGGDDNGKKFVIGNTNIRKEVDGKLSKLEKRLRSVREKSTTAALSVSYLSEQSIKVEEDKKEFENLNGKGDDERVTSKRKKKFRSYYPKLADGENQPKGFQYGKHASESNGSANFDLSSEKVQDGVESLDDDLGRRNDRQKDSQSLTADSALKKSMLQGNGEVVTELSGKEAGSFQSLERKLGERENLKRGTGMKSENGKPRFGSIQEATHEVGKPRKSRESKKSTSRSMTKEVELSLRINNVRENPGLKKNDFWWMKLPYVFAILLCRGPDKGAAKGLYSLKMDESSPSCTVGFEERRDATNFTYILESFFDDLGSVSAEVVPLSMEEVKEAIKSSMKLIVVRKGQLHLYAGQPLGDVETALRSGIN
ncbi:hypothetical protein MKW98_023573 [Papaver atlanticum]|uniref:Uncharacterized protein n=1 Tax=Papaver atlanticum TaxID=357466 RepID=A0AAD4SX93_9MAGN|nr:hypothetical protein MKW98_023573 [Papaver atlanticum]